jgi:hypothetical protein
VLLRINQFVPQGEGIAQSLRMEKPTDPDGYAAEILITNTTPGIFPSTFEAGDRGIARDRCRELCAHQKDAVWIRIPRYSNAPL